MSNLKDFRRTFAAALKGIGPAAILLVVLLFYTGVGSLAQGEDLNGEVSGPMPEPKVLSRTVTPDAIDTTVELVASADTYIASNFLSANYGRSTWLRLGYNAGVGGNGAERIFLRFDLSSIPSNASINWARFRIYQHTATPTGDGDMGAQSRHLVSNWDEYAVTWSSHQPDWGGVIDTSWIPTTIGWLEGDTTNLVKEWVSGQHPNNGVTIIGDEREQERQRIFYSREAGWSLAPRLIVDYSIYVDTEPPVVSVNPLPNWSSQRFTVSWGGYDPGGSGIDYYDVQYRVAGGGWINWLNNTQSTSAEFVGGANGTTYHFQARGVDRAGNVQPFPNAAQAWTTIDAIAPFASVDPLPEFIFEPSYLVTWTGSDSGGSGIKHYDVQVRVADGSWQDWQMGTTATSYLATGYQDNTTYELRARAVDNAGNVQSWPSQAQTRTTVELSGPRAWIQPFAAGVISATQITVQWSSESSPNTNITGVDIRQNYNKGTWSVWLTGQSASGNATFTNLNAIDGVYCFEARATDDVPRTGDWGGQQCIAVDRHPPFIVPRFYIPLVLFETVE